MNKFLAKLKDYHVIIYLTHVFVVAPLLIIVALLGLSKNISITNFTNIQPYDLLLLIQLTFGILVFLYHGYRLSKSVF